MYNVYLPTHQLASFFLLLTIAIPNAHCAISLFFPDGFYLGFLYFSGIGIIVSLLAAIVIYFKKEDFSFTTKEKYQILKFGLIGIAASVGGYLPVASVLFYERLVFVTQGSQFRNPLKQPVSKFFTFSKPFLVVFPMILAVIFFILQPYNFLPIHIPLASLTLIVLASYQVGGGLLSLIALPGRENYDPSETDPFSSSLRNFKWMLIAFLITSPTVFFPILFPELITGLLLITDALTQFQYAFYAFSSVLIFMVKPVLDAVVFGVLFYRYCVFEDLCPEDYRQMSWNEQVRYAFLNAAIYAFTYQLSYEISFVSFLPLFCFGVSNVMLSFLSGRIDLSIYSQILHNLSSIVFPSFCYFWFQRGYEFTRYLTPITSNFLKYAFVFNLEHDHCNSMEGSEPGTSYNPSKFSLLKLMFE